ncbi:hypothetical protein CMI47_07320 [Candidatus Pacearchaeota archaeon]|jgi:type IV secretory pathway VirD2 relaxase|nr:hypothetical protein [Candidatus Pacearchaeota archaeon]|tara:strand:- start:540 stop:854 length:315 start_codon:yes stop_codon:yes gene_type:complete
MKLKKEYKEKIDKIKDKVWDNRYYETLSNYDKGFYLHMMAINLGGLMAIDEAESGWSINDIVNEVKDSYGDNKKKYIIDQEKQLDQFNKQKTLDIIKGRKINQK